MKLFKLYLQMNIEMNNCVYRIHPIYNLYAANKAGEVINIIKKDPLKGNNTNNGYLMCGVRKPGQNGQNVLCSQICI